MFNIPLFMRTEWSEKNKNECLFEIVILSNGIKIYEDGKFRFIIIKDGELQERFENEED